MQPTYLPWMGFFGMMKSVDLFVFLDDVQFAHRSWQQRNRIRVAGGEAWLTVPVTRPLGQRTPIDRVLVNYDQGFPDSHVAMLHSNYGRSPHFTEVVPDIERILRARMAGLCDLNVSLTGFLANALGVETPTIMASALQVGGQQAELILNICRIVGATEYVSAPGSAVYLDPFAGFASEGVSIEYFTFLHQEYEQQYTPFVSHLSVVDAIANQGAAWVSSIL